MGDRKQIVALGNGEASRDLKWAFFDIQTQKGEAIPATIQVEGIPALVTYLIGLAQFADSKKAPEQRAQEADRSHFEGTLIDTVSFGFSEGRTDQECALIVRTGSLSLGFAIPKQALQVLRDEADRISGSAPQTH